MTASAVTWKEKFPKPDSRLQGIISKYKHEENVIEVQSAEGTNLLLKKIASFNTVETKAFSELTQEERAKVLEKISKVNYMSATRILNFGNVKTSSITKFADFIISRYTGAEMQNVTNPITNLVTMLQMDNISDITTRITRNDVNENNGIFSTFIRIFKMKGTRKKLQKALLKHVTVSKCLKQLEVELKKQQFNLQRDINVYEEMGKHAITLLSEVELDCIAIQLMIDDANLKSQKIAEQKNIDVVEANKLDDLNSAIERLERKKVQLHTVRTLALQTASEIAMLIYGNEIVCEKNIEIQNLVIPLWSWQYAIAIGIHKQQEAVNIQKTIKSLTAKLFTRNAKELHDSMISIQEELYATAVALEDLVTIQKYMDNMFSSVAETQKGVSQKCVDGMKKVKEIERRTIS